MSNHFKKSIFIICLLLLALVTEVFATNDNPVDSVELFVTRFYRECLNREPDQAGLDGWAKALKNGWITGADLAEGFILSPEFISRATSEEDFLNILYQAFFNRQPDTVGFYGWLSALQNGASRSSVLEGFIYSEEFSRLCHQYGIAPYPLDPVEAFVTRFYRECLNREPDRPGLDGWVNGLKNGWVTGGEVAESFIMSLEYTNLGTSNEEFLETLYYAFFNRQPDSVGFNGWLLALRNGMSRSSVLDGFITSDEFFKLCSDYGIDAVVEGQMDGDGDGYTENQGDCNDLDSSIHPGAPEICGDGIDQDCNGIDPSCLPCTDISGIYRGTWFETDCYGKTNSGYWFVQVNSNCSFFASSGWDDYTGEVNPSTKKFRSTATTSYGCGLMTLTGSFMNNSISGSFSYSQGGGGSFNGIR